MKKYGKQKGFTILELGIVIAIFSLFLIAIYTILDAGVKGWNMGQTRTELQNNGEVVIKRMTREITMCSKESLSVDPNGQYVAMETPVSNGEYKYVQDKAGFTYWNGYIIYYIYKDPNTPGKTLYRNYVAHPGRITPVPLTLLTIQSLTVPPSSPKAENKPVASNLKDFNVAIKLEGSPVVNIKILYNKEQIKKGEIYSVSGTSESKGTEIFELQAAAEPRN